MRESALPRNVVFLLYFGSKPGFIDFPDLKASWRLVHMDETFSALDEVTEIKPPWSRHDEAALKTLGAKSPAPPQCGRGMALR